jgi:predicted esterase
MRWLLLLGILSIASPATAGEAPTGLQSDVVFAAYSPWSSSAELIRRALTPLTARRLNAQATASGAAIRAQAIDLAQEKFVLYVPAAVPAQGYALMVFVPPWPSATVPALWPAVLERQGMIFVSAANSGNETSTIGRRMPLALLAAQNVLDRYPVDRRRVYVSGFSGGSRVALRLAVAYPDLFRGTLLAAGSDPLGEAIPPGPAELFRQFQDQARLVYLTGENDGFHLEADKRSRRSLPEFCVFDVESRTVPWTGHEPAGPVSLGSALDALATPRPADPARLAACRADLDQTVSAQLHEAEALAAAGKPADAQGLLDKLDAHYGGLAAPHSLDLAARLEGKN